MLTVHAADAVHGGPGGDVPADADAVVVEGSAVLAVGTFRELTAAHPGARVRRWSGLITPGLLNAAAPALLEAAYHPDPREAGELGTEPITGTALAALGMDDNRWGASARRGLQRMLRHGTTAVRGPFTRPAVRTAVARSGLRTYPPGPAAAPALLDPLAAGTGDEVFASGLTAGGPADLAVFGVPDLAALYAGGAGSCVATVLGGRLVFRRG
ncbi:imidazolonepropionase-like domain-containing protein [Streptomyces sp. NPDC001108]